MKEEPKIKCPLCGLLVHPDRIYDKSLHTSAEVSAWMDAKVEAEKELEKVRKELTTSQESERRMAEALKSIREGCSFPSDEVQKAIRDRAEQALSQRPSNPEKEKES